MGVTKRPLYGGFHRGTVLPNFRMTRATIQYLLEPHDKAVTAHRKAVTGVTWPVIAHVLKTTYESGPHQIREKTMWKNQICVT